MSDIIKTVKKSEDEKSAAPFQYYSKLAKNCVKDTKLAADPAQDNFIKGVLGLLCLCFMFGYGGHLLRTIIGCAYPGYRSLKAILTDDKDDDMAWLRYWVVLSSFSILELVLDLMVAWVPGYLIAKCAFLVWCMAPVQNNGSNIIFNMVVLPLFQKHHDKIDSLAATAASKAEEIIKNAVEKSNEDQ
eukprot:TRINITY_DN20652_c0_g1_i1.p1 TRINITY_DN20652_c0_g1~~TRINITY_DN20652_c0_g1_i1.p1  ORF type:complete len:200 (-),score=75.21 TRINITY_DN20652_c0_g1_i1:44-604(-)